MPVTYRFARDHDHKVKHGVYVAYKAGMTHRIPDSHAAAADAAAAGERLPDEERHGEIGQEPRTAEGTLGQASGPGEEGAG